MARSENQVATMSISEVQQLMQDNSLSTMQKINRLKAANFRKTDIENLLFNYGLSVVRGQAEMTENGLTFGVEIETLCRDRFMLETALNNAGVKTYYQSYNHKDSKEFFKIVTDSSVNRIDDEFKQDAEIVSPILKGQKGMQALKQVCDVLATETRVNRSCGLHVHIGAEKFNMKQWHNLYINIYRLESLIDSFMPESRRDNDYCEKLHGREIFENYEEKIKRCENVYQIEDMFFSSRYFKINPCSYSRHKTVEFRQHGGTTDFNKISMWVSFLRKLVVFSRGNVVENVNEINDIPFLSDAEKRFFKSRQNHFAEIAARKAEILAQQIASAC